ncbi:SDR family NAD(P)-dependent oxidoreductase [Flavitalea flava]
MLLQNKNAVIYGAGGAIGSAVAIAFAREGAKVFLTGHRASGLETLAVKINASGGTAESYVVDATDEQAVNANFKLLVKKAGKIDISFNAIGLPQTGIQGIPLLELPADSFTLPVTIYSRSHFITAKLAAQHMISHKSGVILTLTATPAKAKAPLVGGMAPAWAAIEALTRTFATELGPQGIRVVCLRADGMPETETITEVFGLHAKGAGMPSHKEFQTLMESMTLLGRLPTLDEFAETAVFIASDRASAITGTVINLSCGSIVD